MMDKDFDNFTCCYNQSRIKAIRAPFPSPPEMKLEALLCQIFQNTDALKCHT